MSKRQRSDNDFDLFHVPPAKQQRQEEIIEQKEREESKCVPLGTDDEELQVDLTHGLK